MSDRVPQVKYASARKNVLKRLEAARSQLRQVDTEALTEDEYLTYAACLRDLSWLVREMDPK